jgi:hypothetical protein
MQIPWHAKSLLFGAIDLFGLSPLLYWMQKHVTKRSRRAIAAAHPHWQFHAANLGKLTAPRVLEFGAGKSLAQNLYLSPLTGGFESDAGSGAGGCGSGIHFPHCAGALPENYICK